MVTVTRLQRAETRAEVERRLAAGQTQRQVAADLSIARSTLQDWRRARPTEQTRLPACLVTDFATPEGVRWLHRRALAAHVTITLRGGAGVRVVCARLELSGLSAVIGASDGTQQALNVALEAAVVAEAQAQRAELAAGMAPRQMVAGEDETFHPEVCLVALEPIANFILLEQYAPDRTAATWTQALSAALDGLPVAVIQGTSDEATALRRHQEGDCQAHHAPDRFHVQHEVVKATRLARARQVKQAEAQVAAAEAHWQAERAAEQASHAQRPVPRGRPPAFAQRIQTALSEVARAAVEQHPATARQEEARGLVRERGQLYRPYDLDTGAAQSPEPVAGRFASVWSRLPHLADAADLSARAHEHLAKAQRLTTQLVATVTFFWTLVSARVEALSLPLELEQALLTPLIPALYLEQAAARCARAEPRQRRQALSAQLLAPLQQPTHPVQQPPPDERAEIEQVATDCATLFQRSSSAVEGRNGPLARYHHGRHRLSARKRAALTAVHNFHIRRPDGTTAAERFFGRPHMPLFEQVIARVSPPPAPRRRRPRPVRPPYLTPVAA
jgi:hypothetical protein